jgi:hypothetical protein
MFMTGNKAADRDSEVIPCSFHCIEEIMIALGLKSVLQQFLKFHYFFHQA